MEEHVTILAAFGAGLLSYVSELSLDEMRGQGAPADAAPLPRRHVVVASLAFILGFSLVFVSLGASNRLAIFARWLTPYLPVY